MNAEEKTVISTKMNSGSRGQGGGTRERVTQRGEGVETMLPSLGEPRLAESRLAETRLAESRLAESRLAEGNPEVPFRRISNCTIYT